jgi:hypothetical protein
MATKVASENKVLKQFAGYFYLENLKSNFRISR